MQPYELTAEQIAEDCGHSAFTTDADGVIDRCWKCDRPAASG